MFKPGDIVRPIGEAKTGEIVAVIDGIALVQFAGKRRKVPLSALILADEKTVTAACYDEAVKGLLAETADNARDIGAPVGLTLEIVASVCGKLRRRLFGGEK
jgi:hypothetical protein